MSKSQANAVQWAFLPRGRLWVVDRPTMHQKRTTRHPAPHLLPGIKLACLSPSQGGPMLGIAPAAPRIHLPTPSNIQRMPKPADPASPKSHLLANTASLTSSRLPPDAKPKTATSRKHTRTRTSETNSNRSPLIPFPSIELFPSSPQCAHEVHASPLSPLPINPPFLVSWQHVSRCRYPSPSF